jgi:hypothetical protein
MLAESDEDRWIESKLEIIRTYLTNRFPGYTVTERVCPNLYYLFTVTNSELQRTYGLKVEWSRLTDPSNTPTRIWTLLTSGFVSSAMIRAGDTFYSW